jgi:hypothetical protein
MMLTWRRRSMSGRCEAWERAAAWRCGAVGWVEPRISMFVPDRPAFSRPGMSPTSPFSHAPACRRASSRPARFAVFSVGPKSRPAGAGGCRKEGPGSSRLRWRGQPWLVGRLECPRSRRSKFLSNPGWLNGASKLGLNFQANFQPEGSRQLCVSLRRPLSLGFIRTRTPSSRERIREDGGSGGSTRARGARTNCWR